MSERDARKITIIKDLLSGRFTNAQAAKLLGLSIRQVQRLKAEATAHGVMSILHKSRGRKPANALDSQTAATTLRTYQTELPAYNFCHATDVFAEEKGIFVSVSTVSRFLEIRRYPFSSRPNVDPTARCVMPNVKATSPQMVPRNHTIG